MGFYSGYIANKNLSVFINCKQSLYARVINYARIIEKYSTN